MNTPTQHPPREALSSDLPDLETSRDTIRKADEILLDLFNQFRTRPPLAPLPPWPADHIQPPPPLAALFADILCRSTGGPPAHPSPPSIYGALFNTLHIRADVACMIADAKAALHPDDYRDALSPADPDRLLTLLTDLPAELRVLRRVADHARARYPDLPPTLVEHLWLDHIIPWTKQVELHHLISP